MVTLERLKQLIRAFDPAANGRELAWLQAKTGITHQRMNNWGERGGVPCGNWVKIADTLRCSVDELLGREAPAWPFESIRQNEWAALSERQRGAVERVVSVELDRIAAISGKRDGTTG